MVWTSLVVMVMVVVGSFLGVRSKRRGECEYVEEVKGIKKGERDRGYNLMVRIDGVVLRD